MSEFDQTDFQTDTVVRDGLACFEKSDGIFHFEWAGPGRMLDNKEETVGALKCKFFAYVKLV